MTLAEFFKSLSYGELRQLAMSNDGDGTIRQKDQGTVLHYTNEALMILKTRFDVDMKDVLIELRKHITFYHLRKQFAESQVDTSLEPYLYIKDLHKEPFLEDVVQIRHVYDDRGKRLPIGDNHRIDSVFIPEPLILQVPHPSDGEILTVAYRAKHVPLLEGNLDQWIELPDPLHIALRSYVASKILGTIGTVDALQQAAVQAGNYEQVCRQLEEQDTLNVTQAYTNTRFILNGWS